MIFLFRGLLLQYENFQTKRLGPSLRSIGQTLLKTGARLQGEYFQEDRRKYRK